MKADPVLRPQPRHGRSQQRQQMPWAVSWAEQFGQRRLAFGANGQAMGRDLLIAGPPLGWTPAEPRPPSAPVFLRYPGVPFRHRREEVPLPPAGVAKAGHYVVAGLP
jgi:hypothetical protein